MTEKELRATLDVFACALAEIRRTVNEIHEAVQQLAHPIFKIDPKLMEEPVLQPSGTFCGIPAYRCEEDWDRYWHDSEGMSWEDLQEIISCLEEHDEPEPHDSSDNDIDIYGTPHGYGG